MNGFVLREHCKSGDKDLFQRFYINSLKKFLELPSYTHMLFFGYQVTKEHARYKLRDLADCYKVYLETDEAIINIIRVEDEYVIGNSVLKITLEDGSLSENKVVVAIPLKQINWSLLRCEHFYKRLKGVERSFIAHAFLRLIGYHRVTLRKFRKLDEALTPISDRYLLLEYINERDANGELTTLTTVMKNFYGDFVFESDKKVPLDNRMRNLLRSLEEDGFILIQDQHHPEIFLSMTPKGISEISGYDKDRQRHIDNFTTAQRMKWATYVMAFAVVVQAAAAAYSFYNQPA